MSKELTKIFNSFINEESENDPSLTLDSYDGKIDIQFEDDSAVTPYGNLSFFIEYLKTSGLFDALVSDSPIELTGNRSSKPSSLSEDLIPTFRFLKFSIFQEPIFIKYLSIKDLIT